jgi:exopolysaccharide production protein ExoZ
MRKTVESIQFLRFVAATLVVLVHTTIGLGEYFPGSISKIFAHVAHVGGTGVHIFFVISGFVMIYTSFGRPDAKFSSSNFLTRRLIRIYPIYFIYAAFYLYFYYIFAAGKNLSLLQFIGAITLFPGYSSNIIGPGWTLAYEMYFYLCFGVAMVLGLTRGIVTLTLFFLTAIASRVFFDTSQPTIHVLTNSLLIEFLAGAWIGYAVVNSVRISNRLAETMVALALAGFLAGIVFGYNHLPALLTWGVPSALLVAGLVFRESNGHISLPIRNYAFMGDSSYSLYLLHVVLIDGVIFLAIHLDGSLKAQATTAGTVWWIMISLAITIYCVAVAYVSYEVIERRLVRGLQGLYRKKIAAVPAE